ERGKCACSEGEDFMRSDGATCGYCGCLLPTRHSKKDARYSSDSVGSTSAAGTSESPSPENILPKFYLSFWTTCPYKERFCHCFVTERKRQWEVHEALKAVNHRTPRGN
ncbi:unnamed protein product, partial [Porites lobata]